MSLFVLLLAVRVRVLTGSGTGGVGDDLFLCLGACWRWLPPVPIFPASRRHNHRTWRRWQGCTGRPPPRTLPPHAEGGGRRAVLAQKQANEVPPDILAKKNYRINMASGRIAGSKPLGSDCDKHRRRNYVVRISSTDEVRLPNGSVEERPASTFGAVLHYAAVFIDGLVMAFDFVERAKSAKDRRGRLEYSRTK